MQTGPLTKRGKTKSSMNAMTHGLTSSKLISEEETALHQQTIEQLNAEYQPQTFTENMLVERVALHYVRLQRAITAEAASVEKEKIILQNSLPIQQTFDLTDNQAYAYAAALSNGSLTPENDKEKLDQLMTQAAFKELIELDSQKKLHQASPLAEKGTVLGIIFNDILFKTGCTIDELFDGRFTYNQILRWALSHGNATPINFEHNPDHSNKPINIKELNIELLRRFGELTVAIQIHPDVKKLDNLTNNLALFQTTDLDKINRHLTNADRQFSKALGELRHVVDERRRKEALNHVA